MEEEELKKKQAGYKLGQDLSELSVDEIDEMTIILKNEVERLKQARQSKSSHLSAAEALFRK